MFTELVGLTRLWESDNLREITTMENKLKVWQSGIQLTYEIHLVISNFSDWSVFVTENSIRNNFYSIIFWNFELGPAF
jgi:hypothetical protein